MADISAISTAIAPSWRPLSSQARMKITREEIDDFIRVWEHAFNERLSREEAEIQANRLLEFFSVILRPLPGPTAPPDSRSDQIVPAA